ncbi:MAG TPA: hypothetical protein VF148_01245 [Acidimicrobiia bacterium]
MCGKVVDVDQGLEDLSACRSLLVEMPNHQRQGPGAKPEPRVLVITARQWVVFDREVFDAPQSQHGVEPVHRCGPIAVAGRFRVLAHDARAAGHGFEPDLGEHVVEARLHESRTPGSQPVIDRARTPCRRSDRRAPR